MKTVLLLAFFCLVFAYVNADDKVRLHLYFESKCPDSKEFVNDQLYPTYQKLNSIINLRLVPFGNANVSISRGGRTLTYSCQHGPDECWGNKYQVFNYIKFKLFNNKIPT